MLVATPTGSGKWPLDQGRRILWGLAAGASGTPAPVPKLVRKRPKRTSGLARDPVKPTAGARASQRVKRKTRCGRAKRSLLSPLPLPRRLVYLPLRCICRLLLSVVLLRCVTAAPRRFLPIAPLLSSLRGRPTKPGLANPAPSEVD